MGISSQIFIQATCREPGLITWVQFLEGLPPQISEGKKTVQNFSQFLTTFDFDREYLQSGSTTRKSKKQLINYDPSHVGLKKVFELWSTNEKVIDVSIAHRSAHFRETVFSPLGGGGLRPEICTCARD